MKKKSNRIPYNELVMDIPRDVDLEEAVLGVIMIDKDAYSRISEYMKPEYFYKVSHQIIFEAIMTLAMSQKPIDIITVSEQLRKNRTIDDIGGSPYITLLTAKVSSSAHLVYHAHIITQKFFARKLISISSEIQMKAFDKRTDIFDLIEDTELTIRQLADTAKKILSNDVFKSRDKPILLKKTIIIKK